ncbi:MAG: hypothetical protein HZA78_12875 [Candidatus Schekmanbacteria bacterium]|nr:hypothetical protein [Candidatus Schekmanbacteria bacterium]
MNWLFLAEERALISRFLTCIEAGICPELKKHSKRFPTIDLLLAEFYKNKTEWETSGLKKINEISDFANKMCLAQKILSENHPFCEKLEYKPSDRPFDFMARMADKLNINYDIKTINNNYYTTWEKCELPLDAEQNCNYFEGLKGELWQKWYNTRRSMLEFTVSLEKKIRLLPLKSNNRFILTLCGNGFDWGCTGLKEFADFYWSGRHDPNDALSEPEDYFVKNRKIALAQNIDRFSYLERKPLELRPFRFVDIIKN